jgi:hypothetical protein
VIIFLCGIDALMMTSLIIPSLSVFHVDFGLDGAVVPLSSLLLEGWILSASSVCSEDWSWGCW